MTKIVNKLFSFLIPDGVFSFPQRTSTNLPEAACFRSLLWPMLDGNLLRNPEWFGIVHDLPAEEIEATVINYYNSCKVQFDPVQTRENDVNESTSWNGTKVISFQRKLTWQRIANRVFGLVKRTCGDLKDIDTKKTLYCGLVRPLLEYSYETWNPHTKRQHW